MVAFDVTESPAELSAYAVEEDCLELRGPLPEAKAEVPEPSRRKDSSGSKSLEDLHAVGKARK